MATRLLTGTQRMIEPRVVTVEVIVNVAVLINGLLRTLL